MEQSARHSRPLEQHRRSWNSLEDRVEFLLRRIAKLTEERHRITQDVARRLMTDGGSLSSSIEELNAVSHELLPQFADRGAGLAGHIAVSASLAESNSRRVKQLDFLLGRVQEARLVADSLQEMRRAVMEIQSMIDRDELEATVQLIRKYEKASGNLGGRGVPARLLLGGNGAKEGEESGEEEGTDTAGAEGVHLESDEMCEERENFSEGDAAAVDGGESVQAQGGNTGDAPAPSGSSTVGQETAAEQQKKTKVTKGKRAAMVGLSSGQNECKKESVYCSDNVVDVNVKYREDDDGVDEVIANARHVVRQKLMKRFHSAKTVNDKQAIMDTVRLLTLLGFRDECCNLYCSWMCEHTIAALNKMVERELRRIDDPNEAGMSHLALVSTALDLVVATFESEEEFVFETFGDAGLILLLTELHSRSTTQCVPVLKDFLKKRQEVLRTIDCRDNVLPSCGETSNGGLGGISTSAPPTRVAKSDPCRTDQILEEMSHLVSCYHLYWTFAQSKQQECVQRAREKGGRVQEQGEGVSQSADSLWSSQDNPLMNAVQEILAIFVPLQTHYFEAAFEQVLQIQLEALSGGNPGSSLRAPAAQNQASASLMTGLAAALYNSTTSGNSGGTGSNDSSGVVSAFVGNGMGSPAGGVGGTLVDEDLLLNSTGAQQLVPITLPDDVFYFLRISLHRAVNTKSTQIISAVFIACGQLVQAQLIPRLQQYAALPHSAQLQQFQAVSRRSANGRLYTIPSRNLRWTAAAQCTVTYIHRFSDELRQLSRTQFSGKDVLRFSELADDTDCTARELSATVRRWLEDYAERCYQAHLSRHMEPFVAMSYEIAEETFYQYELCDPWVQFFVTAADAALSHFDAYLDSHSFDLLLLSLAKRVAAAVWSVLVRKSVSAYGALQADREVRTLRTFFTARAHEEQLREPFVRLMETMALLLLDHPREAEGQLDQRTAQGGALTDDGNGLTAAEKRLVLRCRVEFKQEDIERLRL